MLALDPAPAATYPGAARGLGADGADLRGDHRGGPPGPARQGFADHGALAGAHRPAVRARPRERVGALGAVGIILAILAVVLLAWCSQQPSAGSRGWLGLAVASLCLQGVGAFLAKVVVSPAGPTALLLVSASVQIVVGWVLLRRSGSSLPHLRTPLMRWMVVILVGAAVGTIGYLFALSRGPATLIVPLVATSPALAGDIGALAFREPTGGMEPAGIALGLGSAVLLELAGR